MMYKMNFSILKKIKNLYFNPTVTYLDKLNKKQIEAVTSVKGFIRVIAGPGAGKTKVLTHRAVYLIKEMGVNPYEILSVTFTNKAAFEMKSRIADLIGNSTSLRTQTFHGFCNTLLREEIHVLRYPKSFIIIDEEDQKSIIKDILSSNNMSLKDISFKKCKDIISLRKTNEQYIKILYSSLPIDDSLPKSSDKDDIEEWIFLSYLKHQRQNFCLDFEDLINFAYYILNNFQNIAEKWQDRIKYIQVDEFQDVNKKQMGIALILT